METPQVGSCKVRNLEVKIRIASQTPHRKTNPIVKISCVSNRCN